MSIIKVVILLATAESPHKSSDCWMSFIIIGSIPIGATLWSLYVNDAFSDVLTKDRNFPFLRYNKYPPCGVSHVINVGDTGGAPVR